MKYSIFLILLISITNCTMNTKEIKEKNLRIVDVDSIAEFCYSGHKYLIQRHYKGAFTAPIFDKDGMPSKCNNDQKDK